MHQGGQLGGGKGQEAAQGVAAVTVCKRNAKALLATLAMAFSLSASAAANGIALDLSGAGAYAGWAGNGTYTDPAVPFNNGGTIEAWLKPVDTSTGLTRVIAASENDYAFVFTDAGALGMLVELGPANWHTYYTPDGVVGLGTWQHVAVPLGNGTLSGSGRQTTERYRW